MTQSQTPPAQTQNRQPGIESEMTYWSNSPSQRWCGD